MIRTSLAITLALILAGFFAKLVWDDYQQRRAITQSSLKKMVVCLHGENVKK